MTLPPEARNYLRRLRAGLAPLPEVDRDEITREIESHLHDRLAAVGTSEFASILARLGEPEDHAASFVTGYRVSAALASGSPFTQFMQVLRMIGTGVRGFFFGFIVVMLAAMAIGFFAIAMLKPILPDHTGLFLGPEVFGLGIFDGDSTRGSHEVLGWWVIPIAAVSSVLLAAIAGVLARAFLRHSRWTEPRNPF